MEDKVKLLFVNNNLDTGGVQRSLVNLLNLIQDKYEVTLFVFSNSGEYKDCLLPGIRVMEASPLLNLLGISQEQARAKGMGLYLTRGILAAYTKLINNRLPIRLLVGSQKKMKGYDVAISFLHNCTEHMLYGGCNDFVLKNVEANRKITFLHCDFLAYGGDNGTNRRMYERFDGIATVSEGCRKNFLQAVPQLEARTFRVTNCHDYGEYRRLADQDTVDYSDDCLHLITVARLGEEKGIPRGIEAIARLIQEGYKVKWHIVGDGPQREEIEEKIFQKGLEGQIFLYGNQQNPYRYMKNADAFLIPSYHEAAPMVIEESKALGLPVVTTRTISAEEMILENEEGFICENRVEGLYRVIKEILDRPEKLALCRACITAKEYGNERALEEFDRLVAGVFKGEGNDEKMAE